jgi:L-asparaginase
LEACKRATQKGVVVVRSSRVATGDVARDVEVKDDEIGTIASYELNPQKSRILLSVALNKPRKPQELQKIFKEY